MSFDLSQAKIKTGDEYEEITPQEEPVEETTEEPTDEPKDNDEPVEEPSEEPSKEPKEEPKDVDEPKEEPKEPQTQDILSERFGGKYKSWEEVEEALNKTPEPQFKDEFIKKVVDKYEKDGDLTDFFKAHSTDWNALDDQEVLKRDFFEQHNDLDSKAVERLWKKEVNKYQQDADEYDEDDIELGKALMQRDAKKVREAKIEHQQSLLQPTKNEDPEEAEKQKAQAVENLRNFVNSREDVKQLKESKIIPIEIDGESYNFEVDDPETISESMVDENLFFNQFVENKNGKTELNTKKWTQVMAFAQNPQKFTKSLVDYGRSMERKSVEDELKNPSIPGKQNQNQSNNTGDFKKDLLTAFAERGVEKKS